MTCKDLTGQRFGKLTALRKTGNNQYGCPMWLFQCECGKRKELRAQEVLRSHPTKSCGCLRANQHQGVIATAYQVFRKARFSNSTHSYADGNLTFEQFLTLSQLPCHYCGAPPSNQYNKYKGRTGREIKNTFIYSGLDRIDNARPHDYDNVVPACRSCNSRKSEMNRRRFLAWIRKVYEYTKEN